MYANIEIYIYIYILILILFMKLMCYIYIAAGDSSKRYKGLIYNDNTQCSLYI